MGDYTVPCAECGAMAKVRDVQVVTHPDRPFQVQSIDYQVDCPNCGERSQSRRPPAGQNPEPPH